MPLGAFRLNTLANPGAAAAEEGRTAVTITPFGDAQIDTAQSKFGGASALFDGTGDYLSATSSDFTFNQSELTIEFWIRPTDAASGSNQFLLTNRTGSLTTGIWYVRLDAAGTIGWAHNTSDNIVSGSTVLSDNTWYHVAVVKYDGDFDIYLDGSLEVSVTAANTGDGDLYIGARGDNTLNYTGHIEEVRISDTARYTTSFTPSTSAFTNDADTLLLLHMDGTDGSTDFVDDNGGGGGSTYLDGVVVDGNDYWGDLSYSDSGSGNNFTASFHVKTSATPSVEQYFFSVREGSANTVFALKIRTDGDIGFTSANKSRSPNARWVFDTTTVDIRDGNWHHIVILTDTTNTANSKIYIDGVSQTVSHLYTNSLSAMNWGSYNNITSLNYYASSGYIRPYYGEIAQFWADDSYRSIDDFWDSGAGLPIDLGSDGTASGLSQPLYYFNGDSSTWGTNAGTETISFTEYGTPGDSAEGPEVI
jgi:hypothetical protein